MPYVSDAQRRFFHTQTARKAGITPSMVKEYDEASKGKKLPERAKEATSVISKLAAAAMEITKATKKLRPPEVKSEELTGPATYKAPFTESTSGQAQRSSKEKLQEGEYSSMPQRQ